ncbi:hypothetical protein F5X98DRAFT_367241 [Xylaria grammica]|nr:hypothetical protein F5X98DRAFT_367241 [Xylaria grammica]
MSVSDLDTYFLDNWIEVIKKCEGSLEPDDAEQVRLVPSWDVLQMRLFASRGSGSSTSIPSEIPLMERTFNHFQKFTHIFETHLSPGLKAHFFWGIVGVLLQITTQNSRALSEIPRMLKSLGYKAEAFEKHYLAASRNYEEQTKEACFDIYVRLVQFFTTAVKCMRDRENHVQPYYRGGPKGRHGQEEDSWSRLQREFVNTNQSLNETLIRVEKLVSPRAPSDDRNSLDVAVITRHMLVLKLPNKTYPSFFGRVDTMAKIDQILAPREPATSFRSIALFGLGASHGKAIITTRNHNLVYKFATSGLEITSWDAQTGSEFLLSLLKSNIGRDIQQEGISAVQLAEKLSGHALGISHMAGLIQRRSFSITEFMRIYLEDPRRLHGSELQAVWDVSFDTFLVSDSVEQELFENMRGKNTPEELEFCNDDRGFSEAIEPLLTLALIKRDEDARTFSCHRMVQTQFRSFLPLEERQRAFDNAVVLISNAFPKQSDVTNKNQMYQHWTQGNCCLQHVLCLKDHFREEFKHSNKFRASFLFCDLLKDCQRYLYEVNGFKELESVCEVNLMAVKTLDNQEQATDITASTLSHQASMYESIGNVRLAIELNLKGYKLRQEENPLKGGLLGGFEQNLGYNYNTSNEHEMALTWFEKSRHTWIAWNIQEGREADWPTITKKNMARCLLYLERYSEAENLLDNSIKEFKKEKPLNWAMLAFAYFVFGVLERRRKRSEAAEANFMEAQNMWFKGDQTRLHPFNAGCIYKTGVVCLEQGKVEAAIKHLRDSLEITKFHADVMPVEHARSLFKLSEALTQNSSLDGDNSDGDEAQDLRDEAEVFLLRRDKNATEFSTEHAYDKWVPIFWR